MSVTDFFTYIYSLYSNFFSNVDLIYPRLWLGNRYISVDKDFITENGIDIIVNCTKDLPFIESDEVVMTRQIKMIRVPVDDSLLEKDLILMEEYFKTVIPELLDDYRQGKTILIHCFAGKQRSAILMAALLFQMFLDDTNGNQENYIDDEHKQRLENDVFTLILAKRPQAFTYGYRINFYKSFRRYFKMPKSFY
jgi:hypothetical protein